MDILTIAKTLLIRHEGLRTLAYQCPNGRWTIGAGRNIQDRGITEAEAMHLLANDIVYFSKALRDALPWYAKLDHVRQLALLDMAFNLGIVGLLNFKKMLKAMQHKRWTVAAMECLDSKYARQTGQRAATIANMIQTGKLPEGLT